MVFRDGIKKYQIGIFLTIIVAVGIFLRVHNFGDWLFFQGDQARDLSLVAKAVEGGPQELPLLGPKAGGTFLRLGPVFYYFQYLSGMVFGLDEPWKAAYPDLFFSILTIPLLYLFLREFFPKKWSLAIAASYAVCFFAIQYSRFAWNPNSLPFFNLLFFYALLKFFGTSDSRKRKIWTVAAGISYAVASQLHFVCLFAFPIAALALVVFRRFALKKPVGTFFRHIPLAVVILVFFYVPVVLSDIQTNGNNALNFLASFKSKSSDAEIVELVRKDILNFSKYSMIIWSGIIDAPKTAYRYFSFFILAGLVAGAALFRKEPDEKKRMFIAAVLVWFFSYMAVYFPLGSKVQPRHFLPILPLPFIFWGFAVTFADRLMEFKYKFLVAAFLLFLPTALNAHSVKVWFGEIETSQAKVSHPRKSGLLKSVGGESWWHLKKTAEYMENDCEKERIVVIPPKQSFRSLVDYSLENADQKRSYSIKWGTIEYYPDACYYLMYFSKNDFSDRFDWQVRKVGGKRFGDISLVRFEINTETLDGEDRIKNPFKKEKVGKVDLQEIENQSDEETDNLDVSDRSDLDDEDQEKNFDGLDDEKSAEEERKEEEGDSWLIPEDVGRESRVFWKDLLDSKNE
ncbi:MAG: glycosyltransferase family 39 protein [Candidatus Moranbacteria bacterium]|nr:glycosyltransferase family 39 protein [Candidatus Moranbacteria bacterium]